MTAVLLQRWAWRVACVCAVTAVLWTEQAPSLAAQQTSRAPAVELFEVRPNLHMIAGAGGNIAVQIGQDGVVLVDSGSGEQSEAVVAAIKSLTAQPIRYIINTGPAAEHVGGNDVLSKAGESFQLRSNSALSNGTLAPIVATESLLMRLSAPGAQPALPATAWPSETFSRKQKDLFLNREAIQVIHLPTAHSDSDAVVLFRRSDVVVTGDIFDITRFPVIDLAKGGGIQGEVAALNALIELTVPSVPLPWLDEGGTRVIPGHGRLSEEAEVVEYRDMVTIVRDRVRELIGQGLPLDRIISANPTEGFRRRYGTDSGPWTTNMFVEAVYRSLMAEGTR